MISTSTHGACPRTGFVGSLILASSIIEVFWAPSTYESADECATALFHVLVNHKLQSHQDEEATTLFQSWANTLEDAVDPDSNAIDAVLARRIMGSFDVVEVDDAAFRAHLNSLAFTVTELNVIIECFSIASTSANLRLIASIHSTHQES